VIRKGVVFGVLYILLAFQSLVAQRPIPQRPIPQGQNTGMGQTARSGRELVQQEGEEETDGMTVQDKSMDQRLRFIFSKKI
jgi:hypothetical protein